MGVTWGHMGSWGLPPPPLMRSENRDNEVSWGSYKGHMGVKGHIGVAWGSKVTWGHTGSWGHPPPPRSSGHGDKEASWGSDKGHTGVKGHGGQKVKGHVVTWRGKVMGFCPIA